MNLALRTAIVVLSLAAIAAAQNQTTPLRPTWQEEVLKGFVPYHQLTVDDFPINDRAHPDNVFWVKGFADPHYIFHVKPGRGGFVYAYIGEWVVFSGVDKNESSRKDSFRDMKAELPYAQALIDINELHARELARIKTGDLPSGRGASAEAAKADLKNKIRAFCNAKYGEIQTECEAFAKATDNGRNKKKVRELSAEIRKRLEATPVVNVPVYVIPNLATPPSPGATSTTPAASPPASPTFR